VWKRESRAVPKGLKAPFRVIVSSLRVATT
jgi:hypothetical protein